MRFGVWPITPASSSGEVCFSPLTTEILTDVNYHLNRFHGVQHVKNAAGNSNKIKSRLYNTSKKLSVNLLWKLFPPLQYSSQRWFQVGLQSQPARSQTVESQIGHTRCRKPCHQQFLGQSSHTLRRKTIVRLSELIHDFLEQKLISFKKLVFLQAYLCSIYNFYL